MINDVHVSDCTAREVHIYKLILYTHTQIVGVFTTFCLFSFLGKAVRESILI